MGEINFYGIYIPMLLVQAVLAYGILRILMLGIDKLVAKDWIGLPHIFYFCMYVLVLWLVHWGFLLCL
jgi:hypothetical protein